MVNKVKIEFLSLSANESFARTAVAGFFAELDPTIEEIAEIKTSVSEAVSNAIIHGYKNEPTGVVSVECSYDEDRTIFLSVEDSGVGIEDIQKAREPLFTTGSTEERAGMGFTVMESFTDRVEVTSKPGEGTRVSMMKKLDAGYEL
ncbi:anti-sigma F factor [Aminipila butyrica]|uniref:Anti-sigma F factor n=1 Tax=Aminipila butyrica TaxID=433296 RepID=A0A858BYU1_9FIRM|nr:anti-sigma F factor [Aminipila butyrica]QIB69864.1 anti-sigma F factor [Aminipila butyrica]